MRYKLGIFMLLVVTMMLTACDKELDLDEITQIAIEKQEILKKLDGLYELAFTDAAKAETDYNAFFEDELLRDGQNFITDNDVRMRATFTDLAVRLNVHFETIKVGEFSGSLFDLYNAKFESIMYNRSLLGEIPQQIRQGEKLATFEAKVEEVSAFFDNKISAMESSAQPDPNLFDKQWKSMKMAITPDYSAFYFLIYDFQFMKDRGLDITSFFLYPLLDVRMGNQTIKYEESADFAKDIANSMITPAKFFTYNNKMLFYFHLEGNPNAPEPKFNREWVYEFNYKQEGKSLTLSNPRVLRFMHPFLNVAGYGTDTYEDQYFEDLRSVTLTAE